MDGERDQQGVGGKQPKRIVIVGGVAGGASAAARMRRLDETAEIVVFERGEHVSFANCGLPYHIGGDIADRGKLLVQTPQSLYARFRIDVRTLTEVTAIDRAAKTVTCRHLPTGEESVVPYDALVLSPGAAPIRPPLPGLDHPRILTLRNLNDMDAIKAVVDGGMAGRAIVIGGGYIGLEMAEALRERDVPVTLVERLPQVMAPVDPEMAQPLHQQLRQHDVDLRLSTSVTAFEAGGHDVTAVLDSGDRVTGGLVVMAVGVKPETKLAVEAGIELGPRGGIKVDEQMRTSDPSVFAVGDAVEVIDPVSGEPGLIPLAGPANRQGRLAADVIDGRSGAYRGTQGTAICRVFELAVGITGASEKVLKRQGRAYEKVYIHAASHASYYPGAAPVSLKLLFDPADGRILGAQAVGADGVDKRIDVLAVAMAAKFTVYDLEHLELSYAPPFGSAKDPVNMAGFVASNVLRGDMGLCQVEDVKNPRPDQLLLDVRTAKEVAGGIIPGAVAIPVDELRDRLGELPKEKELLIYCGVGLRGHVACRLLSQHGFTCRNLTGGWKSWLMANG